jgi:hypothetical protein
LWFQTSDDQLRVRSAKSGEKKASSAESGAPKTSPYVDGVVAYSQRPRKSVGPLIALTISFLAGIVIFCVPWLISPVFTAIGPLVGFPNTTGMTPVWFRSVNEH